MIHFLGAVPMTAEGKAMRALLALFFFIPIYYLIYLGLKRLVLTIYERIREGLRKVREWRKT